jgi:16S rRNA (guanine966-N2)-methyltransferase
MRIIAGSKRGMHLLSPKGDVSRPIIDRVKESLFSVLYGNDLPAGAMVADVFSGVGSLGLEALSRGAEFVTFVEMDPKIEAVLKKNIEKGCFEKNSKVIRANAFRIGAPVVDNKKYDLVFVDPPYPKTKDVSEGSQLAGLMDVLSMQVKKDALVIVRTEKNIELLKKYSVFEVIDRRIWGTMAITFLKNFEND